MSRDTHPQASSRRVGNSYTAAPVGGRNDNKLHSEYSIMLALHENLGDLLADGAGTGRDFWNTRLNASTLRYGAFSPRHIW